MVDDLISRSTADKLRDMIKDNSVLDNSDYGRVLDTLDDRGTSHVAVVDKYGNAVSVTQTLNFR